MAKEKQVLGPNDVPFVTGDGMLAFALYLAGVPLVEGDGWCRNEYTREMLRGYGFNGVDIRQAATAAVKANKRGKVTFYFNQTPRFRKLLSAYTDQEKQLSENGASVDLDKIIASQMEPDEKMIRLSCVVLKLRGEFMNGWKDLIPFITMQGAGRVEKSQFQFRAKDGSTRTGTSVSHPGLKAFSANASDETLKRLEVL